MKIRDVERSRGLGDVYKRQIEYRVKSVFGDEELTVVLSVLDPKPVTKGSMLHFVSEVNREPLVKMFVDKPDAATFNAFVETLVNLSLIHI